MMLSGVVMAALPCLRRLSNSGFLDDPDSDGVRVL